MSDELLAPSAASLRFIVSIPRSAFLIRCPRDFPQLHGVIFDLDGTFVELRT